MSLFDEVIENLENKCRVNKNITKSLLKRDEFYNVIIDINSISVVPFINNDKFVDINGVNITPFIKTIEFYLNLKSKIKFKNMILAVDNGITANAKKIYPNYKGHRRHSTKRMFTLNKNDIYSYNISLIELFFNEVDVYVDTLSGEADFKIGLYLKEVFSDKENLVVSGDKDLILSTKYSDFLFRRYTKNRGFSYYYFSNDNLFCFSDIEKGLIINNIEEYLLFKALIGDNSDNIKSILTKKKAINFLEKIKGNSLTIENIANMAKKLGYTKNEDAFKNNLILNLSIINIYNTKIFNDVERANIIKFLNKYINRKNKRINKENIKEILKLVHPRISETIIKNI